MRRTRLGPAVLVLALAGAAARAEPPAGPPPAPPPAPVAPTATERWTSPPTPEQAADAVLDATRKRDDAALAALAAKDQPDPWLVAHELLLRGEGAAAAAFATAASVAGVRRPDVEGLSAYVASRQGKGDAEAARKALAAAHDAMTRKDLTAALAAASTTADDPVVAARLAATRGEILRALARSAEAATAIEAYVATAERIGWLAGASDGAEVAVVARVAAKDVEGALQAAERRAGIERRRERPVEVAAARMQAIDVLRRSGRREDAQARLLAARQEAEASTPVAASVDAMLRTLPSSGEGPPEDAEASRAWAARTVARARASGDAAALGRALVRVGSQQRADGAHEEARARFEEALPLLLGGDPTDRVETLVELARVLDALGHKDAAEARLAEAEAVAAPAGQPADPSLLEDVGRGWIAVRGNDRALATIERAQRGYEATGRASDAAGAVSLRAQLLADRGDTQGASKLYEDAIARMDALREARRAAACRAVLGTLYVVQGRTLAAGKVLAVAREVLEPLGDSPDLGTTQMGLGMVALGSGSLEGAAAANEKAAATFERLGLRKQAAAAHSLLGTLYGQMGDAKAAEAHLKKVLDAAQALRDPGLSVMARNALTLNALRRGDSLAALEAGEPLLAQYAAAGKDRAATALRAQLARAWLDVGDLPRAREASLALLADAQAHGEGAVLATPLFNLGGIETAAGEYEKALAYYARSLALAEEAKDGPAIVQATFGRGVARFAMGDAARALSDFDRTLTLAGEKGSIEVRAATLANQAALYESLGDVPRALSTLDAALAVLEGGDFAGVTAATLGNLGSARLSAGDPAGARDVLARAVALCEKSGAKLELANALLNLAVAEGRLDRADDARARFGRALELAKALARPDLEAAVLFSRADHEAEHGRLDDALAAAQQARSIATDAGARREAMLSEGRVAALKAKKGDARGAVEAAREAAAGVSMLLHGLSDVQGAGARGTYVEVFDVGASAAASLGDVPTTAFFLETGRAGSLLEALGGRERLWSSAVAPSLRTAEEAARAQESVANARYRRALQGEDLAEIRGRRAELAAAQQGVLEATERIQREAKAVASVLLPRADDLATIRGRLAPGEALVLYGTGGEKGLALVATSAEARVVPLAPSAEIAAACEAVLLEAPPYVEPEALGALRRLVVEPLALPEATTRVLVSPDGPLSYLPFALLLPDREVAYEPSGTTYGLLLEDAARRGEGVLAVGDPDTGAGLPSAAIARSRGGTLARLPATRAEARAVGDVVLLDREATEAGLLAAIGTRPRWHAIHLACHGLVDVERPALSALALTPAGDDDGFLTALELFRSRVPSDLLVLSACETAKGKVVRGEGILGLARALMFAGSPRVICSLWKVDDEATGALMTKFYELWNPRAGPSGTGTPGLPTAQALRRAQEFVRSQERWKHPYYWAAWVLWGLPS